FEKRHTVHVMFVRSESEDGESRPTVPQHTLTKNAPSAREEEIACLRDAQAVDPGSMMFGELSDESEPIRVILKNHSIPSSGEHDRLARLRATHVQTEQST